MREPGGGPIPIVETYRGVGLHDQQSPSRLKLVRREIDHVLNLADPRELLAFAVDVKNAPEARLLAEAMCESLHNMATESRAPRPVIDFDYLHACCAGLSSNAWRSPWVFGTLADRGGVPREQVLTDKLPPP